MRFLRVFATAVALTACGACSGSAGVSSPDLAADERRASYAKDRDDRAAEQAAAAQKGAEARREACLDGTGRKRTARATAVSATDLWRSVGGSVELRTLWADAIDLFLQVETPCGESTETAGERALQEMTTCVRDGGPVCGVANPFIPADLYPGNAVTRTWQIAEGRGMSLGGSSSDSGGNGYTVVCADGTTSDSGGVQGACSSHGGVLGGGG